LRIELSGLAIETRAARATLGEVQERCPHAALKRVSDLHYILAAASRTRKVISHNFSYDKCFLTSSNRIESSDKA